MDENKEKKWSSIVKTDRPIIIKEECKKVEKRDVIKKEHTFETIYEMSVFDTLYSFRDHPLVEYIDINDFVSFFYTRLKRKINQNDLTNDKYHDNEKEDIYQSLYSSSTTNNNYTVDDDYMNL